MHRRIVPILLALGCALTAPAATAADDAKAILGTWDVAYNYQGNEMKAGLTIAKNSDGSLVAVWTRKEPGQDLNTLTPLSKVEFENGKLTFVRLANVQGQDVELNNEVTFDGDKVMGKIIAAGGEVAFRGQKRGKIAAPARRGGGSSGFLRRLIRDNDKNGDGKLQKSEASGPVEAFFDRLDSNGDGEIDRDEIRAAIEARGGGESEAGESSEAGSTESSERTRGQGGAAGFIERFDKDKDGKVQSSEAPEQMTQFFDMIDRNGDGGIDKEEYEAMQRFRQQQQQ